MSALKDVTSQRFGKLVVLRRDVRRGGKARWECACDCGQTVVVPGDRLRTGMTKSCGCGKYRTKHGQTGTRIYRVWSAMIQRCENPSNDQFGNYGARGITVCAAWHEAASFIHWAHANGYRDDLELDRCDNERGYGPGNCRFVTSKRNKRNMRKTTMVDWMGHRIPLADLADETGIPRTTLRGRIFRLGMSVEDAVQLPRDTWQTRRLRSH